MKNLGSVLGISFALWIALSSSPAIAEGKHKPKAKPEQQQAAANQGNNPAADDKEPVCEDKIAAGDRMIKEADDLLAADPTKAEVAAKNKTDGETLKNNGLKCVEERVAAGGPRTLPPADPENCPPEEQGCRGDLLNDTPDQPDDKVVAGTKKKPEMLRRFEKALRLQERRIGDGVARGWINSSEREGLIKQQQDMRTAMTNAWADGKLTKGEQEDLKAQRLAASKSIFEEKHDLDAFETRIERQKDRIAKGLASKQLTQKEADTLNAKVDAFKAKIDERKAAVQAGDPNKVVEDLPLTMKERKDFTKELNADSRAIQKNRTDAQGKDVPDAERKEIQKFRQNFNAESVAVARQITHCEVAGNATPENIDRLNGELQTMKAHQGADINTDMNLTKAEKDNLHQEMAQLKTDLNMLCRAPEAAVARPNAAPKGDKGNAAGAR
ncbi:MAG TPA: hypothetical protein VIH99_04185 [Bdellovibrionota bacterium]|jgi:predicted  nucleic acid-binding Zn-ribbon protein